MDKNTVSSYQYDNAVDITADDELAYLSKSEIEKRIRVKRKNMEEAAKALDFIVAAKLRDEIKKLKEIFNLIIPNFGLNPNCCTF